MLNDDLWDAYTQRWFKKIREIINEPTKIQFYDFGMERKVRLDFPDNWYIMIDEPDWENEKQVLKCIEEIKVIRQRQLKSVEKPA